MQLVALFSLWNYTIGLVHSRAGWHRTILNQALATVASGFLS